MERYFLYSKYLTHLYGHRVYRVGIDAGFSCPNRNLQREGGCIYCDASGGTAAYLQKEKKPGNALHRKEDGIKGEDIEFRLRSIGKQIDSGIAFLKKRYQPKGISLYLQAFSNTYAPIEELRIIYNYALQAYPFTEFIISTRGDCIDEPVADLLHEYREKTENLWVELGMQSAHGPTLEFLGRGHSVKEVVQACRLLRERGIKISLHIILGLPGEGWDAFDTTAEVIRKIHPDALKIHNLHIPIGTPLFDMYMSGEVVASSDERHITRLVHILKQLPGNIPIQRIVCDTPAHRLAAPKLFAPKAAVIQKLKKTLELQDTWQGKDIGWALEQVGVNSQEKG